MAALPAAIVGRFRAVALERIESIESAWTALTQGAGSAEVSIQAQRELHTLKGDAHVLNFGETAELCHKLEELFAVAHQSDYMVSDELDLVVTMAFRFLATLVRKQVGEPLGGLDFVEFIRQVDGVLADVRPSAERSGESRLSERAEGLAIETFDRVSVETQHRLAVTATRIFIESLVAEGPAAKRLMTSWLELQQLLATFSTVSLRSMLARYAPAALELGRKLGKQVEVDFDLVDVPVRRELAEALDIAALHALRNAMDHGIEPPHERRAAGKAPTGRINICARVENELLEVSIEDDGRGIDWDAVRKRGIDMGFLTHETAARASEYELSELLFQPGFSTRIYANAVSGRGIGLDAVRAALAKSGARGGFSLRWRQGRGTTAILRVPQPRRWIDVLWFRDPDRQITFAVPQSSELCVAQGYEGRALYPLEALGIAALPASRGATSPIHLCLLQRTGERLYLCAASAPSAGTAERICPTSDVDPAEVIRIEGRDALLLRPEHLAKGLSSL